MALTRFLAPLAATLILAAPFALMAEDLPEPSSDTASASTSPYAASPSAPDLDLSRLKRLYQNAIVKIEFTAISNQEETKLNPTKSEIYYSGSEPPHGSGFFISDREILTNAHVVEQARRGSIRIKSPAAGNVEFRAEVVGVGGAETIDLAVLRLPADEAARLLKRTGLRRMPTLSIGDSDTLRQADPVAIFGYPQASDELKIIQAKVTGREYLRLGNGRFVCGHQFIEVGPGGVVQPGNSGGPALDRDGRVVGIPARGSGYGSEQGFLIPSRVATHFLDSIRNNDIGRKGLPQPKLGIGLVENFAGTNVLASAPEDSVLFELGIQISEVLPKSLAANWGLKERDILIGFSNPATSLSAALDFRGYRVTTGHMANWPQDLQSTVTATLPPTAQSDEEDSNSDHGTTEPPKLHLTEMVLMSSPGDPITLWFVRPGTPGIQTLTKPMEYVDPMKLPPLGTYDKPPFELWGDFVAQDFNDLNVALFEIPLREVLTGGVVVTFVEPNSLASRRGMSPSPRSLFGFSFGGGGSPSTSWVLIDSVNGAPVKTLAELRKALRDAEKKFDAVRKQRDWKPERLPFTRERYVEIGFRTNTTQGAVLKLRPAFPIDEALESREAAEETARATTARE
jgi:S1-C subfamily serine protease